MKAEIIILLQQTHHLLVNHLLGFEPLLLLLPNCELPTYGHVCCQYRGYDRTMVSVFSTVLCEGVI